MVAKRLAAVVAAAALIVAAVLIRTNVLDDDGSEEVRAASTLVCLTELQALCRQVPGVRVRIEDATATTDAWQTAEQTPDEVWLTFQPLPEAIEIRRSAARRDRLRLSDSSIAASQLALVVPAGNAPLLQSACPTLTWICIGQHAGQPWQGASGSVRPAFAPLNTGIGQVSVTAAVMGFFGDRRIDATDPDWITWSRGLRRVSEQAQLTGRTPIGTIQVRASALDVAIGAEAELANEQRGKFEVLYPYGMTRLEIVLTAPDGRRAPDGVLDELRSRAENAGWSNVTDVTGTDVNANDVIAATAAWSQR